MSALCISERSSIIEAKRCSLVFVFHVPKVKLFALDRDSTFAFGILFNLRSGLETLSVKEDGFVLALAALFLESVFVESWLNYLAIVLRMAYV